MKRLLVVPVALAAVGSAVWLTWPETAALPNLETSSEGTADRQVAQLASQAADSGSASSSSDSDRSSDSHESRFSPDFVERAFAQGEPIAPYFNELNRLASTGDPVASYLLFDLARRCAGAPRSPEDLDEAIRYAEQHSSPESLDGSLDNLSVAYAVCEGLPPGELSRERRADLIKAAAAAGIAEARREYLPQVLAQFPDAASAVNHAAEIEAELRQGEAYLLDNVRHGDIPSLLNLGDVYASDIEAIRDDVRAAALYSLHAELSGVADQGYLQRISSGLTPEERNRMLELIEFYRRLVGSDR